MTAGAGLYLFHPRTFWGNMALVAFIDLIFHMKEGYIMKKARVPSERNSWWQCTKERVIVSWEAHLPSRRSLLMSL